MIIAPVTVCLLVAAVIVGFTLNGFAGAGIAVFAALLDIILGMEASSGTRPPV
jgi:hypothetical protein